MANGGTLEAYIYVQRGHYGGITLANEATEKAKKDQ